MLGAAVLTVAQMCAVGYGLGSFGWWGVWTATLVNVAVSVIVWWCGQRPYYEGLRSHWTEDMKGIVMRVRGAMRSPFVAVMAVLVVVEVAGFVWLVLSMPSMAYDGWGYHTSKAVLMNLTGWIQPWMWDADAGKFVGGYDGYEGMMRNHMVAPDFYPANGSILQAYWIMYTGSVRSAGLVQLPFAGMGVVAVYRLVRRVVRGSLETAAIVGLSVMGLWTVMGQAWYALSDLMSTGLLWAGYALVMVPIRWNEFKRNDVPMREGDYLLTLWRYNYLPLILSALAAGLALGTKVAAGYWCIGILALAIYQTWRTR